MCLLSGKKTLNSRFRGVMGERETWGGVGAAKVWVCSWALIWSPGWAGNQVSQKAIWELGILVTDKHRLGPLRFISSVTQWLRQRWGKSCLCALQSHSAFCSCRRHHHHHHSTYTPASATFCAAFCSYQVFSWPAVSATAGMLVCSYHQRSLLPVHSLTSDPWHQRQGVLPLDAPCSC